MVVLTVVMVLVVRVVVVLVLIAVSTIVLFVFVMEIAQSGRDKMWLFFLVARFRLSGYA